MTDKNILIYGADWCFDCRRAKNFLLRNKIAFEWVNIEQDVDGEQVVLQMNHGIRSIPTILFGDGSVLVEPSNAELARKLGIPSPTGSL